MLHPIIHSFILHVGMLAKECQTYRPRPRAIWVWISNYWYNFWSKIPWIMCWDRYIDPHIWHMSLPCVIQVQDSVVPFLMPPTMFGTYLYRVTQVCDFFVPFLCPQQRSGNYGDAVAGWISKIFKAHNFLFFFLVTLSWLVTREYCSLNKTSHAD